MKTKILMFISASVIILNCWSCKKSSFLDAKPDQSLVVPTTLPDLQALLDNDQVMNGAGNFGSIPSLGEVGADNYYIIGSDFNSFVPLEKNAYVWAKQIYSGESITDWDIPYRAVFYANVALQGLDKLTINNNNQVAYNNVKGSALFLRSFMFYHISQVFATPYNKSTAATDLGIPLRLIADVGEKITRSTVQQTYDQVISDIKKSIPMLPGITLFKTRPSKVAAYGLLARVYLSMQDYDHAFLYADSSLQLQNNLIDYNTLNGNSSFPIARFNNECIFQCTMVTHTIDLSGRGRVDSNLYISYQLNDLRKSIYFKPGGTRGGHAFKGSYDGSPYHFGGLATDEMYLIRAECNARKGNTVTAMSDLNTLLQKRWISGTFQPYIATSSQDALNQILIERRKELIFRGIRWSDLRRLNKDPQYAIALTRNVLGQEYTLPPNDNRYIYPIPDDVIGFNPSMPQNPR